MNCRQPSIHVSYGAPHSVGSLMAPVAALKSRRPHSRGREKLALDITFPRLARSDLDDRREELIIVVRVAIVRAGRILEALRKNRRDGAVASHDTRAGGVPPQTRSVGQQVKNGDVAFLFGRVREEPRKGITERKTVLGA